MLDIRPATCFDNNSKIWNGVGLSLGVYLLLCVGSQRYMSLTFNRFQSNIIFLFEVFKFSK